MAIEISGYPETWHTAYYLYRFPMKHTVLGQIADFITTFQHKYGSFPGHVNITEAEHAHLKLELDAKGSVSMVNGLKVYVIPGPCWAPDGTGAGVGSDLPQPPPLPQVPDLKPMDKYQKQIQELNEVTKKELFEKVDAPAPFDWKISPLEFVKKYGPAPIFSGWETGIDMAEGKPSKSVVKVYHQSGSDEHGTPQDLFDRLNEEFQFDLDVCATEAHEVPDDSHSHDPALGAVHVLDPGNAKCPIYFTEETDGLKQDWFGTVWMNPPYTKGQVKVWILKMIHELQTGHISRGVALVAARPDTAWFSAAASHAAEIRFLKGRLTFQGSVNPAPFPSALLVFDKKKTAQIIKFWDWKLGVAVKYVYQKFGGPLAPNHPLLKIRTKKSPAPDFSVAGLEKLKTGQG